MDLLCLMRRWNLSLSTGLYEFLPGSTPFMAAMLRQS